MGISPRANRQPLLPVARLLGDALLDARVNLGGRWHGSPAEREQRPLQAYPVDGGSGVADS